MPDPSPNGEAAPGPEDRFSVGEIIQYKLLKGLSRLLVRMPTVATAALCSLLGTVLYCFFPRRRRILLRNLHHSFPHWPESRRRQIARRSCAQTIELGLLAVASWAAPETWIRKRFLLSGEDARRFRGSDPTIGPCVVLTPHLSLAESQCFVPLLSNTGHLPIGVVYRPFRNRAMDWFIREGRERWGSELLSRKEGFHRASGILRRKGLLAILFDQNAGDQGSLTPFLGRLASTTELPALLACRHRTRYLFAWVERTGFWQGILHIEDFRPSPEAADKPGMVTLEVQQWLEHLLTARLPDPASWLWAHNRWKTQHRAESRLRITGRRTLALPDPARDPARATRFWLRLPDDPALLPDMIPILQSLQQGRPDVLWHLAAPAETLERLPKKDLPTGWSTLALAPKVLERARQLRNLRTTYPDLYLSLQPTRFSWEARLARPTQILQFAPSRNSALSPIEAIRDFLLQHGMVALP